VPVCAWLAVEYGLYPKQILFRDYADATTNHSGNALTGAPRHVIVGSLQVKLPQSFMYLFSITIPASIPLNDASIGICAAIPPVAGKSRVGNITYPGKQKLKFTQEPITCLNAHYSLGNDLNAGSRWYFNPSPLRNYYAGFNLMF